MHPLAITLFGWLIDWSGASAPLVRSSSHRIAVDLPNGRHGAPNGGVAAAGAEETVVWMKKKKQVELVREAIHGLLEERRRRGHGEDNGLASSQQQLQLQEEEGLLSSLLTKVLYILCVWIVSDFRVHAERVCFFISWMHWKEIQIRAFPNHAPRTLTTSQGKAGAAAARRRWGSPTSPRTWARSSGRTR